jgi:hypothetical protein
VPDSVTATLREAERDWLADHDVKALRRRLFALLAEIES